MQPSNSNVSLDEIAKFDNLAANWWDKQGDFKPLHDLNPTRLDFIAQQLGSLEGLRILDVGCGGGIVAEGLALRGAVVTAIDLASAALDIARQHALEQQLTIDYQQMSVEELARAQPAHYDAITCLEMLEHVPDPAAIISACAQLVKPHHKVFFSTLNRTFKAKMLGIYAAESILKLLPTGTHDYQKLIKPSELDAHCRRAGLNLARLTGIGYNPFTRQAALIDDVSINYLCCYQK